ncbi:MAG: hypothetical protein K2O32_03265 [Acetatifactor sp.]|nr:hypothetical protein [Acetatifactor sp.]
MKDRIKKIFGWRPGAGWYAAGAVVLLVLLLYPLLRLAAYSVPWYDDYNYGRFAKAAMSEAPTLENALKGTWECIRTSWYAWQGTYGSIFFMVLTPGIWGEEYYHYGPIFLILLLTLAICVLVGTLLREVLRTDLVHTAGLSAVSAAMTVLLIYTAQEGFYWYNGGVHYVGMHAFGMLLVVTAVKIVCSSREEGWKSLGNVSLWAVLGSVLALFVAGSNFVTALQVLLVLLTVGGIGILLRRRRTFFMIPMLLVYAGGFYMNVTAPGNDKRAQSYIGWGKPPFQAVLYSFVEGGKHAWEFTGWMTLVFLLLMLPLILHMVKRTKFSFPYPGVVSLWSACLYATGFTPSLYSLGHGGLSRTLNAVKLTWELLLILNVVYWCGWLCRLRKSADEGRMWHWWFYPLILGAALLVFVTEPNQAGSFSSYGAYYYIHTGEAYNFYQEYLERVELLKSDKKVIELTPYHWRPWFLCMPDLSDDPKNESNRALAAWYQKDEIICRE